jgi:hypothetical protein
MVNRICLVGLLLSIIFVTAEATRAYTAPAEPQTRVETDQATGAIRFIVKGQEQARIDSTGLHVRHHIDYGGAITDEGAAGYEMLVKSAK